MDTYFESSKKLFYYQTCRNPRAVGDSDWPFPLQCDLRIQAKPNSDCGSSRVRGRGGAVSRVLCAEVKECESTDDRVLVADLTTFLEGVDRYKSMESRS